jgi:hypothetical protein
MVQKLLGFKDFSQTLGMPMPMPMPMQQMQQM